MDFTGEVEVRAPLEASGNRDGVTHLDWASQRVEGSIASMTVHALQSGISVTLATRLEARGVAADIRAVEDWGRTTTVARWDATPGQTAVVEKVVVISSSREAADTDRTSIERLAALAGESFDSLFAASAAAWERDWALSDIVIDGDAEAQLAIRSSLYHLLIAAPRGDDQVSIGAKTLSGFGYHGHVFWDTESFMLPFFTHVHPSIARDLLSYRYHRLPGARRKATAGDSRGRGFPWESAETGDEVTPSWGRTPATRHA